MIVIAALTVGSGSGWISPDGSLSTLAVRPGEVALTRTTSFLLVSATTGV